MQKNPKQKPCPSPLRKKILSSFAFFFFLFSNLWARDFIGAEPAIISLQDIFPGEKYDIYEATGYQIIIPNAIGSRSLYRLNVNPPEQVKPLKGFLPLPDTTWFRLKPDSLVVEPYDTGRVNFYIAIPEGEEYRNQAYQVEIHIVRRAYEKERTGTTVGIVLGLNLEYFIETSPKPNPSKPPDGVIGVAPSQFFIRNPSFGKDTTLEFRVYNGDTVEHEYSLSVYVPPPMDTLHIRLDLPASPAYEWIPAEKKADWISLPKDKVKVKPGSSEVVKVVARFPDLGVPWESLMNRGWEGVVAVVPDAGYSRFVRVKYFIVEQ